jgi:fibro-slime domain-containing protein
MWRSRSGLFAFVALVALSTLVMGLALGCGSSASAPPGPGSGGGGAGDASTSGTGGFVFLDAGLDSTTDAGCLLPDGAPCHYVSVDAGPQCGDGIINQPGEVCDDGNRVAGDGCSGACKVEPFFVCPTPGEPCAPTMVCGDGQVTEIEECDDGNVAGGDGCSASCRLEASYYSCPPNGGPCVSTVACGDGRVEAAEICDDGNPGSGDGCSSTCQPEPGWSCRMPGAPCIPNCGDGQIMAPYEECDDGNRNSGDGCSISCRIEAGWLCPTAGQLCTHTVCGDGFQEGTELCDVGADNGIVPATGPGCTLSCTQIECASGRGTTAGCTTSCGDGMRLGTEACDDGNLDDGDGCSSTCAVEPGFTCTDLAVPDTRTCSTGGGQCLVLPMTIRDFKSERESGGHPDFFFMSAGSPVTTCVPNANGGTAPDNVPRCLGLVGGRLDSDGKPDWSGVSTCYCSFTWYSGYPATPASNTGNVVMIHSAAGFDQWYRTTAGVNTERKSTVELGFIGGDQYQFSRLMPNGFFPLDGTGESTVCQSWPYWAQPVPCTTGAGHNYYFTTEVRYLFAYQDTTNLSLTFTGDDDVWVFVNGILALDLGGTHQQLTGTVNVNSGSTGLYSLAAGHVYEIVVFHADRHPIDSNYQLTLSGFAAPRSDCNPTCGDGIRITMEECDNGAANVDTLYGGCTRSCTYGPFCGDAILNGPEECDDGQNTTTAYGSTTGCAPGCLFPPRCGDGTVDPGEECDDGALNADGTGGGCSSQCRQNPRCGDGVAVPEAGEECDYGDANEPPGQVSYGGCTTDCQLGPYCGDGTVDSPQEFCDDHNNGDGDGCSSICVFETPVQ